MTKKYLKKYIKKTKKSIACEYRVQLKKLKRYLLNERRRAKIFIKKLTPAQRKNIVYISVLVTIGLCLGANFLNKNMPQIDTNYSKILPRPNQLEINKLIKGN